MSCSTAQRTEWPAIVTTASERGSVNSAAWGSVAAPTTAFLIAANGLRSERRIAFPVDRFSQPGKRIAWRWARRSR